MMFGLQGIYLKLAEFAVLIAFLFGVYYWVGYQAVEHYKEDVALVQAKADAAQQAKYNVLSTELETLKTKRQENAKIITKTVEKIVTRDVYRDNCIDSDGLSVANQAISGSSATKSDATLSPTK